MNSIDNKCTTISVAVITKNEAHNISECLSSVSQFSDIVVVDSFSRDTTTELAKKFTNRVYLQHWLGFSEQKQHAVNLCVNDWVLVLDADERVSEALAKELRQVDLTDPTIAYQIYRKNFFIGQPIDHCGWNRDCPIRLFNKQVCRFEKRPVHEKIIGYRKSHKLSKKIIHLSYRSDMDIKRKIVRYSSLSAVHMKLLGRKPYCESIIALKANWAFFRVYILDLGILDGCAGYRIARMRAKETRRKYELLAAR